MTRRSIRKGLKVQRGAVRPRSVCFRRMPTVSWVLAGMLVVAMFFSIEPVVAQSYKGFTLTTHESEARPIGLDDDLLSWLNRKAGAFISGWMQSADATFYPVTYASVPLYWGASLIADDVATEDALAFTAGWVATAGSTILMKRLVGRKRPYVIRNDLVMRYSERELKTLGDTSSFPSGHTSMSVFLATYMAAESNTAPVRITGGLWATSVAISRIWNGVHFPTDVFAGAILGSSVALLTHHMR